MSGTCRILTVASDKRQVLFRDRIPSHRLSAMTLVPMFAVILRAALRAVRREAGGRRASDLALHRLLHRELDGTWTWRVRGEQVPASRDTDVCLMIEPDAETNYCPDCLLGTVRWGVPVRAPQPLECRDCRSLFGLSLLDRRWAPRSRRPLVCRVLPNLLRFTIIWYGRISPLPWSGRWVDRTIGRAAVSALPSSATPAALAVALTLTVIGATWPAALGL